MTEFNNQSTDQVTKSYRRKRPAKRKSASRSNTGTRRIKVSLYLGETLYLAIKDIAHQNQRSMSSLIEQGVQIVIQDAKTD